MVFKRVILRVTTTTSAGYGHRGTAWLMHTQGVHVKLVKVLKIQVVVNINVIEIIVVVGMVVIVFRRERG